VVGLAALRGRPIPGTLQILDIAYRWSQIIDHVLPRECSAAEKIKYQADQGQRWRHTMRIAITGGTGFIGRHLAGASQRQRPRSDFN